MKNIMSALGLGYDKKYYKLPDAEMVVESRYGLDSVWIVGRKIGRDMRIFPDILNITATLPDLRDTDATIIRTTHYRTKSFTGAQDEASATVHDSFLAASWSAWTLSTAQNSDFRAFYKGKWLARFVTYSAQELRVSYTITTPTGNGELDCFTTIRLDPSVVPEGQAMVILDHDPSTFGIATPTTSVTTWVNIITFTWEEGITPQPLTIFWRDANDYPFFLVNEFNSGDWQGRFNVILNAFNTGFQGGLGFSVTL